MIAGDDNWLAMAGNLRKSEYLDADGEYPGPGGVRHEYICFVF